MQVEGWASVASRHEIGSVQSWIRICPSLEGGACLYARRYKLRSTKTLFFGNFVFTKRIYKVRPHDMKRESRKLKPSIRSVPHPLGRDLSFIFDDPNELIRPDDLLRHIPKDKAIALRLPADVVNQYKKLAAEKNKKYQKLMFEALIEYLVKTR